MSFTATFHSQKLPDLLEMEKAYDLKNFSPCFPTLISRQRQILFVSLTSLHGVKNLKNATGFKKVRPKTAASQTLSTPVTVSGHAV